MHLKTNVVVSESNTLNIPNLSPKQNEYLNALISGTYKYLLYGGAVGGGKTYLTLGILDELCRQYPGARFGVVRKSMSVLKRNTIPSYFKILRENYDGTNVVLNRTNWVAQYSNGSRIDFVDADISKDPQLNKLKGLELTGCLIEEANEVDEKAFDILKTRIGRWMNAELGIKQFIILTCNPDNNWVKHVFYDPWELGRLEAPYYYLPALPKDNPFLPQDYLDGLEDLGEAEYKRYVEGNWNYTVNANQLIATQWVKGSEVEEDLTKRVPKYIAVDYAREGDDYSVLTYGDDNAILWFERYKFDTANPLADIIEDAMLQYDILEDHIAVDAIGNGAALLDVLEERSIYIGSFKSSEHPTSELKHFTFANRKSEAQWLLREDLRKKNLVHNYHSEFYKQCQVINYFVEEKCIKMETKKETKKRLKYSPDFFDSAVIFNFMRNKFANFGKIYTSYVVTLQKRKIKENTTKRKYLPSVKKMIY